MKHKHFIFIFLTIALISLCVMFFINKNEAIKVAEIYSDNTLIHRVDLSKVNEAYELPVSFDGHTNVVLIERGKISVKTADCPDKLCVNQGYLSSYPIVCVPNKLYIKSADSASDVDAVSR